MNAGTFEVLNESEMKCVSGGNMATAVVVVAVVIIAAAGAITGWANGYGEESEKAKDRKQKK